MSRNSTKYAFAPEHIGKEVRIFSKGWKVTAETLTDEQAEYMLANGYAEMIETNERKGSTDQKPEQEQSKDSDSTDKKGLKKAKA